MSKLIRKTLADSSMTHARKRKLARLAARPDDEIDFSEIPPLKESFWKNAVRNPFYRPVKQPLTLRPEGDNRVLREAMLEDIRQERLN